jgi:hypothetical protein
MTISDINQEIRDLCDADSTSLTNATLLRRVNTAYETVVGKIIRVDGFWQFDDDNFSTSPRGTGTLVSGQHIYTFSDKFLQVEEIDILDTSGYFKRIEPFDAASGDMSFEEYFNITYSGGTYTAPSGFPSYYDKQGSVIRLDKAPTATTATLTSGLRVTFKRTADTFTSAQVTTGTKQPGFDSQFHIILCYMAAIPFCQSYKKDRVALYEKKVMDLEKDLLAHYGTRQKDERSALRIATINFR